FGAGGGTERSTRRLGAERCPDQLGREGSARPFTGPERISWGTQPETPAAPILGGEGTRPLRPDHRDCYGRPVRSETPRQRRGDQGEGVLPGGRPSLRPDRRGGSGWPAAGDRLSAWTARLRAPAAG